jgi:ribonucleoside-diphosphate reductase alpha chain
VYKRRQVGEEVVVNKRLVRELSSRGVWTKEVRDSLIRSRVGGVGEISEIPKKLRELYKTAWEMSPKVLIDHAAARGPFVDQSQSLNLFIEKPTVRKLTQIYFYAWRKGLKTMSYYVRGMAAADAQKVTVSEERGSADSGEVCRMEEGCVECSS